MASQTNRQVNYTHKDKKPRKRLLRERLIQNGTTYNLRKLSNRKRLVVRK